MFKVLHSLSRMQIFPIANSRAHKTATVQCQTEKREKKEAISLNEFGSLCVGVSQCFFFFCYYYYYRVVSWLNYLSASAHMHAFAKSDINRIKSMQSNHYCCATLAWNKREMK